MGGRWLQQLLYDISEGRHEGIQQVDRELYRDQDPEQGGDVSEDSAYHAVDELLCNEYADGRYETARDADERHSECQALVSSPDQSQNAGQAGKGREDMPDFEFFFLLIFFLLLFGGCDPHRYFVFFHALSFIIVFLAVSEPAWVVLISGPRVSKT